MPLCPIILCKIGVFRDIKTKPYKHKAEHADSQAIIALDAQHNKFSKGSGRIAHICELLSGISQPKGLANHDNADKKCLKGPLWAPSSSVSCSSISSAPCRDDRVSVVHAVCGLLASEKALVGVDRGPTGERGKERGPENKRRWCKTTGESATGACRH